MGLLTYFVWLLMVVDPVYPPLLAVNATCTEKRAGLSQPEKFSITSPVTLPAGGIVPTNTGKGVATPIAAEH